MTDFVGIMISAHCEGQKCIKGVVLTEEQAADPSLESILRAEVEGDIRERMGPDAEFSITWEKVKPKGDSA